MLDKICLANNVAKTPFDNGNDSRLLLQNDITPVSVLCKTSRFISKNPNIT
jgi:hypothetical protein